MVPISIAVVSKLLQSAAHEKTVSRGRSVSLAPQLAVPLEHSNLTVPARRDVQETNSKKNFLHRR